MKSTFFSQFEMLRTIQTSGARLNGFWAIVLSLLCIGMSITHLLFNSYWELVSIDKRALHLAFVLLIVFILYPVKRSSGPKTAPSILDLALGLFGAGMCIYMFYMYEIFAFEGEMPDKIDLFLASIAILVMFEATRRSTGWPLVILCSIFFFYPLVGHYAPFGLKIAPFSFNRIVYQMFYSDNGIFGTVLGVSATFIFMFVLFGAFLGETKSSDFFNDISLALAGHKPGGPAKVAVIASMTMGTISGSAVANVATTGTITIPLMKRVGYSPHFSGGVEAVASTGGSIMPPVMASAAFIMAEILGIPYLVVIKAALIPAMMYYLALWMMLDLEARKLKLSGLSRDQLPSVKHVLMTRGHLLIPIVLIISLLVSGRTPLFCAFWGIVFAVGASMLRKETRMSLPGLLAALREGAIQAIGPSMACAIVGIIVGVSAMTGFGPLVVGSIIDFSGGNLPITLVLTMIACLILGMGLPTAACYITAATIAAPALIKIGVPPISAHLFVLYYAVLSSITPPVALASFTAAGIAESTVNKVSWIALRLGAAGFIVPMMFIYSPGMLMDFSGMSPLEVILMFVTILMGIMALAISVAGYFVVLLGKVEQACFFAVAILMISPSLSSNMIGLCLLAIMAFRIHSIHKRVNADSAEKHPLVQGCEKNTTDS